MGIMSSEWTDRLDHWMGTLKKDFYTPVGQIDWSMYTTMDELSYEDALKGPFKKVEAGTKWGSLHEYAWLKSSITLPKEAEGERIVLNLAPGGESTLFVNGKAFGTYRADWVREPHHYMVDNWICTNGHEGDTYDILMETYAGQYFPIGPGFATGGVLPGTYEDPGKDGERVTLGPCSFGIWNEEAYQLWMDADTLRHLLGVLDERSLRAAKVAKALEQFTLAVDFEQDRAGRIADYKKAREILKPALEAKNGSTMPMFYAVGNSHLDLAWLWPMHETYRKTARTFAAQLRLIDQYPDYVYIQSQPASYEMCRKYYPELFERIKKAIKKGQWIADGAMWVEPDTNMSSGEALIRQLVHGKRYYKDVLGVDSETLWLPDTFGYTGALPQILKSCGVRYMVTQKIYWTYNESEQFPYHYFNWEGIDGTKITAFLPTSYTYFTSPTEANGVWNNRAQKQDLDGFLFPYGYGDGGGGACRDYIEYVERQKDLEGGVRMKHASPRQFFEEMEEQTGGPVNTYRGELYLTAHRGTYTTQAKIKYNNRRAELGMREMEMWGSLAETKGAMEYPFEEADRMWKEVLLHQFHDILPGSGIREIYEEAEKRVGAIIEEAGNKAETFAKALTSGEENTSVFNSLSFDRKALVQVPGNAETAQTAEGVSLPVLKDNDQNMALVEVPSMGAVTVKAGGSKQKAAPAEVEEKEGVYTMSNGLVKAVVDAKGEVLSFKLEGDDREFASGAMNHFLFYKDTPRKFDAWDIDSNYIEQEIEGARNVKTVITNQGGACAVLSVKGQIGVSTYTQDIILKAGSKRLEFRTSVDWKELHRLLKVSFPVSVYTSQVINEMQFGYVERPNHRSRQYDKDRFEVCNHRYSAMADGSHGAAVLNDCKYGMSANGNEIQLTLLTASASPEMRADNRMHHFTYAFYAFEGPFSESDVVREGLDLNVPVLTEKGTVDTFSAFRVSGSSVVIDTVKPAEDGSKDLVLRLYDSKKCAGDYDLTVNMPAKSASLCNMLEEKLEDLPMTDTSEGKKIPLTFRDFEIKTIRLSF